MKTFYVDSKNFNNNIVLIDGDEHNHLKNVLRLNVGTKVLVVCGDDYNYECEILKINKASTELTILNKTLNLANPKTNLTAFVALIKNDKLNLTIQKLTELGVTNIVPFESAFTVIKDNKNKHEKLQLISNQSVKQCGRSKPTKVFPTINIKDIVVNNYDLFLFANESEHNVTISDCLGKTKPNKVAIIIGPEGGFSAEEKNMLIRSGAKSISLSKRILRAETAAIMLTTLTLEYLGEFK